MSRNKHLDFRRFILLILLLSIGLIVVNQIILHARWASLMQNGDEHPLPIASVNPQPGKVYRQDEAFSRDTSADVCVDMYPGYFAELGETGSDWRSLILLNHRPILKRSSRALPLLYVTECWTVDLASGQHNVADFLLWSLPDKRIFIYSWAYDVE